MVDVGLPGAAAAVVVVAGADDDVVVAVAVDIAGPCHASTEFVACSFALVGPVGIGILGETRGGAVIDIGLPDVCADTVVAVGAYDDIVVAVTVDIAGAGYADAEVVIGVLALYVPVGSGILGETRGGAVVDIGLPGHAAGIVVVVGADDDIGIAVAVDVAGVGHAVAEVVACSFALVGPVGIGILGETRGGAVVDIGLPGHASAIIVAIGADDNIIVTVVVDVAGRCHADAEEVVGGLALVIPVGSGGRAGGRAVIHIGFPGVAATVVVVVGAHDDIVVAVTVDIARSGHVAAEVVRFGLALVGPGRGRGEPRGRPVVDIGFPGVVATVVVVDRTDDDVVVAVAVDVAGSGHAVAEVVDGGFALGTPGPGEATGELQGTGGGVHEECLTILEVRGGCLFPGLPLSFNGND